MSQEEIIRSYKALEVDVDSSLSEINNAYNYLKKLYSGDSVAIKSLHDELSEENRDEILSDIEYAHSILLQCLKSKKADHPKQKTIVDSSVEAEINKYLSQISYFRGENLKEIRSMRGVELKEVAAHTNISRHYLENIELEKFAELPAKIYLKGFIASYAEYLEVDSKKVAQDMIGSYEAWLEEKKSAANER